MKSPIVIFFVSSMFATVLVLTGDTSCAQSPASKSKAQSLGVDQILKAFRTAELPIDREIIYTDQNDPNKLLGRPHQYIAKASWADKRIEQSAAARREERIGKRIDLLERQAVRVAPTRRLKIIEFVVRL